MLVFAPEAAETNCLAGQFGRIRRQLLLPMVSDLDQLIDHDKVIALTRTLPPALLKLTLTLTSHLGQNDGLGEGEVGSFPET